ncbi:MAG: hypothetical protein ACRDRJ_32100 [Streptosporangiaceae bacterium]
MRGWYRPRDLLGSVRERVIPQASTLAETVSLILAETRASACPTAGWVVQQAGDGGDDEPGGPVDRLGHRG